MSSYEQFEKLEEALQSYAGWATTMWFYTVSHSELVLQLRAPEAYRTKFLVFSGCRDICVPANGVLSAVIVGPLDDLASEIRLFDGFRVQAETWRLADEYTVLAQ